MKTILTLFAGIMCQISIAQSIWVDEIVSFNQGLNNDGQVNVMDISQLLDEMETRISLFGR